SSWPAQPRRAARVPALQSSAPSNSRCSRSRTWSIAIEPGPFFKPPARPPIERIVATVPNLRVLVAEDENLSRRLLVNVLESWGYTVVVACNGQEAWDQLCAPDPPPLVLLDWMMPGVDGLE